MEHWTELKKLKSTFNDAVNYKSKKEKEFFNKIFLRTNDLHEILESSKYFLIGEKGSGKTAYASFLENNDVEGNRCKLSTMTETQYKRFIEMKRHGKLDYSDYANIWRPILLVMMAQAIISKHKGTISGFLGKFSKIEELISEFNQGALNPEIEVAFQLVTTEKTGVSLGALGGVPLKISAEDSAQATDNSEIIKHNLLQRELALKQAIADLNLSKNVTLFMDGIDFRPSSVPSADYVACVKGLGEAAWQLNSEYFSNIRDSRGRLKTVLLVRPDVFHTMNLYNSNSRLRDNSVLLDWSTTESALKQSNLYEAADKYFSSQQSHAPTKMASADHYLSSKSGNPIFRAFLRVSFQKPRDLLTFINIAKDISVKHLDRGTDNSISPDITSNPIFTKEYADYLYGEVRNYVAFYMGANDFEIYMKFFQFLDGKSEFDFDSFSRAFEKFKEWVNGERVEIDEYLRDAEALLQFFYDVNALGYKENMSENGSVFYHFAYRERTLTNIAPKIKSTGIFMVNRGLSKALDIGLRARSSRTGIKSIKRAPYIKREAAKDTHKGPPIESSAPAKKGARRRRKRRPRSLTPA